MLSFCILVSLISFSEIKKSSIAASTIIMKNQTSQKYDAEVKYLDSTGNEFIVIPFDFKNGHIRIEGKANSLLELNVKTNKWYLGMCNASSTIASLDCIYLGFYDNGVGHQQQYYDRVGRYSNLNGSSATTLYDDGFVLDYNSYTYDLYRKRRNGNLSVIWENTTNIEAWNKYLPQFNIDNIVLFGALSNGIQSWPSRIYRIKVIVDDNVIYDLIAVRKNGIGYMYDKISEQLFGNNGTGNFVIGPDKH